MSEPRYNFNPGPAPEVVRHIEQKGLRPSFDWRDVWAEEHAIAFTVAKSTGFDILEDIHEAIHAAVELGQPFEQFRTQLEPRLRARGWWGRREVTDPATGEVKLAELGSRRRLRIIYEANMRSARAAGQWERAQKTRRMLPFFLYRLGPSRQHRPQHVAWDGLILPVDDPFWDTHYPPNGWGCKCWLRQISRREAARLGGPGAAPDITWRDYHNPRDGRTYRIPDGIDPGWHTNPGKARAAATLGRLVQKMRSRPSLREYARQVMRDFWQQRIWKGLLKSASRMQLPVALVPFAQDVLESNGDLVVIANHTIPLKQTRRHGHVPAATWEDLLLQLPDVLEKTTPYHEVHAKWGRQLVYIVKAGGRLWRIVIRKSAAGYLYISTIHPTGPGKIKRHKK